VGGCAAGAPSTTIYKKMSSTGHVIT